MKECCGYCEHHRLLQLSYGKEWCCCNPDSDYIGYETEFKESCDEFEAKEGVQDE